VERARTNPGVDFPGGLRTSTRRGQPRDERERRLATVETVGSSAREFWGCMPRMVLPDGHRLPDYLHQREPFAEFAGAPRTGACAERAVSGPWWASPRGLRAPFEFEGKSASCLISKGQFCKHHAVQTRQFRCLSSA